VDGSLGLPFVGLVDVQGLTLQEVDDLLTQSYAPMLTRPPQLTVTLLKPRPVRVVVAGEVRRPGSYSISFDDGGTAETSIGWPTLTQVIRESGGITEQADVRRIELIRPNRSGEATVFEANLWDLIQSGDLDQDIRLRDGDRIIVPVATSPPEEALRVATSNFSPDSIEVQVVGEVPLGGTISLPVNASLNQAILAAGGLDNPRVQSSSVELVRLNLDGTVLRETYPVDLASEPNDENNPILRANDVVVVRRNTLARSSDFLSVLTAPFIGILTLLNILGL
jgi:polysaccharide export outer membrane protein